MDAATRRRNELDAKKAKLAELRRSRKEREHTAIASSDASELSKSVSLTAQKTSQRDIDELVDSLVGQGLKAAGITRVDRRTSKPGTELESGISASQVNGTHLERRSVPTPETPHDGRALLDNGTTTIKSDTGKDVLAASPVIGVPAPPKLAPVKEIVTYSKGTQTQTKHEEDRAGDSDTDDGYDNDAPSEDMVSRLRREIEDELKLERESLEKAKSEAASALASIQAQQAAFDANAQRLKEAEAKLAEVEASMTLPDYTNDAEIGPERSDQDALIQAIQFYDDSTRTRMITSLAWSPKFPELVLASYSKDVKVTNKTHGLILVWNTRAPETPQFSLSCSGEVQQAIFSPFHANIIIGGSYSGQIMIWDVKIKRQPVLTTPLTGKGHTYPITGLHVIGTKQSHSIVSTSSDGTVCVWSSDLLAQPQDTFQLSLLPPSKVEEVTPTAVSHTPADTSTFLIGTEDGNMYNVNRQDRAGAKAGIDPTVIYRGHATMITGLDHHRCKGQFDFSDLVLTCSLDWTVRLWRVKMQGSTSTLAAATAVQALNEFELDDMVYDVRWSPARPGVFACVDGVGQLHIYNLCNNVEVPIATAHPSIANEEAVSSLTRPALNKVIWDHDGRRVAVGGIDGRLSIFDVPASVSGKDGLTTEQWHQLNNKLKGMATRSALQT